MTAGLHGLPRFARSDGVRFKVRMRYRPGFGRLAKRRAL